MSRNRHNHRSTGNSPIVAAPTAPTVHDPPRPPTPARITTQIASFQGPLPPPGILEQYNHVMPNGAERIMAMAEGQALHRRTLEARVVNGNVAAQTRGQYFGFALGVLAIVGGVGLIAFGKDVQGLVAIITAFVSLAGVFVYGRWQQTKERDRKRREFEEESENPRLPFESN